MAHVWQGGVKAIALWEGVGGPIWHNQHGVRDVSAEEAGDVHLQGAFCAWLLLLLDVSKGVSTWKEHFRIPGKSFWDWNLSKSIFFFGLKTSTCSQNDYKTQLLVLIRWHTRFALWVLGLMASLVALVGDITSQSLSKIAKDFINLY